MTRPHHRSRPVLFFLCVPAIICLLAACGSSSSGPAKTSTGQRAGGPAGIKLSATEEACLKKAGVTLPSTGFGAGHRGGTPPKGAAPSSTAAPSKGTGTGATGRPPAGARRTFKQSAKVTAALKTCGVSLPAGGAAGGSGPGGAAAASAS